MKEHGSETIFKHMYKNHTNVVKLISQFKKTLNLKLTLRTKHGDLHKPIT